MEPVLRTIPFTLATAGHVDHGKSALVRALTGIDPDRLPEEKLRGITIDLGFAHLRLASPQCVAPPAEYQIGWVDVPGHEDYVRNMIAGVGKIDAALLVVAADDGWMPQTEEHLQILTYLGVTRAVVALSKADLVSDEQTAISSVRDQLRATPFADAAIVPTSVTRGAGLKELTIALAEMLSQAAPQADLGKPRLPIDRVFAIKGVGTIVTGTLAGGTLHCGQSIVVQPLGSPAKIRAIQTHNRSVETALPGSRVALNLPGLVRSKKGNARSPQTLEKGDVVTLATLGPAQTVIDALLERSPRPIPGVGRPARPLRNGVMVHVHHGSGSAVARVRLLDAGDLGPGQRALARLTLQTPLFAFAGDRFIVRDAAQLHTLAGGLVLDPDPPRKRAPNRRAFRGTRSAKFSQQAFLNTRAQAPKDIGRFVRSQLERDGVVELEPLLARSCFSAGEIIDAVRQEVQAARALFIHPLMIDAALWMQFRDRAEAAIDAFHLAHPEQGQYPFTELRSLAASFVSAPATQKFSSVVAEELAVALASSGFIRTAQGLHRASHQPALPPRLQSAGLMLRKRLAERPMDPPGRNDLCRDDLSRQALRFLIAAGEAVEIGPDLALSADAFQRAVAIIRNRLGNGASATVAELKTLLSSTRRVTVPLLERLDRDGITLRQGDLRTLKKA